MRKKRKLSGGRVVFGIYTGVLFVLLLSLGRGLFQQFSEEKVKYQSVVSLEGTDVSGGTENLQAELKKIRGFCFLTPVIEIPVRLRAEDYTMDTVLTGTALDGLEKKVSRSAEVPLGTRPVLLLGEKSLAAMTDRNGHVISEEKQREFLERYEEICWQYCLAGEDENTEEWDSCLIAGVLSFPSEGIYMPYSQAEALAGTNGTSKFLLTVRGKGNYEKAAGYFGGTP